MPDQPSFSRLRLVRTDDMPPPPITPSTYVELGVSSPFSFLRGASDAIELVQVALALGFDAIGIAGTGLTLHRKWLDAVSDNIANVNTAVAPGDEAFRARYVLAQAGTDSPGAYVAGTALGSAEGRLVHQPDHPLADEDGYVRLPDIDFGDQMSQLILAQRGYQASAAVVDRARNSYEAALQIGRS